MKFFCPHDNCDQKLEASHQHAGQVVSCPTCEKEITIPGLESFPTMESAAPPKSVKLHGSSFAHFLQNESISPSVDLGKAFASENISVGDPEVRYLIGDEIARGGMGAVLLASDVNIRREVAMKRMLPKDKIDDGTDVIRFIEEAQITGQLEHPSIVPVYELGVDSEGQVFYTMKRIEGETLQYVLAQLRKGNRAYLRKWPLNRLLRVFLQVCDAIGFAHAKGVIHRDLKPENIMVGEYGEVLVVDWGIAKVKGAPDHLSAEAKKTAYVSAIRHDDGHLDLATLDGTIAGTPQYMAPEQAAGEIDKIADTTDVFSLGAILFEILTLRPPYRGGNVYEILAKAETANHTDLRSFSTSGNSEKEEVDNDWPTRWHCEGEKIPDALAAVTMKAMARSQGQRYAKASELKEEIENYLNGFSTSAENAGFLREAKLFIARNKAACTTAAAAALVIFAGSAASVVINQRAKTEAQGNLAKFVEEQQQRVAERKVAAPALRETGRDLVRSGQYAEALAVTDTVLEYRPDNAEALLQRAVLQFQLRDWEEAEAAWKAYQKHPESTHAETVQQIAGLIPVCRVKSEKEWPGLELANAFSVIGYPEVGAGFQSELNQRIKLYDKALKDGYAGTLKEGEVKVYLHEGSITATISTTGTDISHIKPLQGIPIESLLLHAPVDDLSPLQGKSELRFVRLNTRVKTQSLAPLAESPIETLEVMQTVPVTDLSPLEKIPTLRKLTVPVSKTDNLQPLKNLPLTDLKAWWVGQQGIDLDISPLSGMKSLRRLEFTGYGKLTPMSALSQLPLKSLISQAQYMEDMDGIPLHSLQKLQLTACSLINDFSPLKNSGITDLYLSETRAINDYDFLADMPQLKTLRLESPYLITVMAIERIPPLPQLTRLQLRGGFPRFFPEPRHFPNLTQIVLTQDMHLTSPRLYLAVVFENWSAAQNELDRLESLCRQHDPWKVFLPELKQTRAAVEEYQRSGTGLFASYIRGTTTHNGHRYLLYGKNATRRGAGLFAEMFGGHLVTITDQAEQDVIVKKVLPSYIKEIRDRRQASQIWMDGVLASIQNERKLKWETTGEGIVYQNYQENVNLGNHPIGSGLTIQNWFWKRQSGQWNFLQPDAIDTLSSSNGTPTSTRKRSKTSRRSGMREGENDEIPKYPNAVCEPTFLRDCVKILAA